MDISEKILNFRAENNLTQPELAKIAGVSTLTIWRAENKQNVRKITLAKILNVIEKKEDK